MKKVIYSLVAFVSCTLASAAPFTALPLDEAYGVGTTAWRLASHLSRDATGTIELCYVENAGAVQVLGRVGVRPFTSSTAGMPDLRILFTRTQVNGTAKVVVVVGYGIRSGCFVVDAPELTAHSLFIEGTPEANPAGEYNLVLAHKGNTMTYATRVQDAAGRLYFRYIPQDQ